jgi:hypothetical protein
MYGEQNNILSKDGALRMNARAISSNEREYSKRNGGGMKIIVF